MKYSYAIIDESGQCYSILTSTNKVRNKRYVPIVDLLAEYLSKYYWPVPESPCFSGYWYEDISHTIGGPMLSGFETSSDQDNSGMDCENGYISGEHYYILKCYADNKTHNVITHYEDTLADIAISGNIDDIIQQNTNEVILNCGNSDL